MSKQQTPPANLVLPYYAFASIAFLVLTVLMFFSSEAFIGHYFNPKLLAITHIATIGWASMIIFGSLYQLLPVILNVTLYSTAIAKLTFICFALGIALLAYAFWTFSVGSLIQTASIVLVSGATLFLINIICTAKKAEKMTIEADFITTSALWFWITVVVGGLMAYNFNYVFLPKEHLHYLKLHAHIGIAGWFILLIIGVSSKLIPMFLLSPTLNVKKLNYAYFLINITLIGFIIDSLFFNGISRGIFYFIISISGILFYISFLFEAYKKRSRKFLDVGMKQSLYAVLIIVLPIIFGLLAHSNVIPNVIIEMQIKIAYGVSFFLGFISLLILGQTFKTLPFIVWLDKYQNHSGKEKPLPKNLYWEILVKYQLLFFISGLLILLTGILFSILFMIKTGCVLFVLTAILYNINVFKIMLHKPKINN